MSASNNIVPTSPFIQFATLPISTGYFEAAMDIFGPFADVVERTVPGCLEFALYKSVNNETGEINIIISERYVHPRQNRPTLDLVLQADIENSNPGAVQLRQLGSP